MDIKQEISQKREIGSANQSGPVFNNTASNIISRLRRYYYVFPFLISFLLSRGIIFGVSAPFGLAFSAVLSYSKGSVFALIGGICGALSVISQINSLKYIACHILVFTIHFVFGETSFTSKKLFAPLSVLLPLLCIDGVFLTDDSFPVFGIALAAAEIFLAMIFAITVRPLFAPTSKKPITASPVALLVFTSALLLPIYPLSIQGVSLGRVIATALILLITHSAKVNISALVLILFGISASLAYSTADYCMIYALTGMISSMLAKQNKYVFAFLPLVFSFFVSLCFRPIFLLSSIIELLLSALAFLLLCKPFCKHFSVLIPKNERKHEMHIKSFATKRLALAAEAFGSVYKFLNDITLFSHKKNILSPSEICAKVSGELCKTCTLSKICWEKDYQSTKDSFNNAVSTLKRNGSLSAKDFPIHFSSRCLHFEKMLTSINRELFAGKAFAGFSSKLSESKALLARQYADTSSVFSSMADDVTENSEFDENTEHRLDSLLSSRGILCETAVYRGSNGRLNIHLCGKDLSAVVDEFDSLSGELYKLCKTYFSKPILTKTNKLDDVIIREKAFLRGVFGAAVKRKTGEEASGDSGSFFSPSSGKLAVLLSDGMGSGKLAAADSASSVRLLEALLKSGIAPQSALATLHTAFSLKSEQTGVFSTLDLLCVDMYTGKADFYKYGGAVTYIKRGKRMRRITSASLPIGMNVGEVPLPDHTSLVLHEGDFVIMTSDGVADEACDDRLLEFLSASEEASPKRLADEILAFALSEYNKNDDMTVAVLHIESNE